MKKVLAILLCLILVLGMAACASTNPATENKTEAEPATTAENTPTPAEETTPEEQTKPEEPAAPEYPETKSRFLSSAQRRLRPVWA